MSLKKNLHVITNKVTQWLGQAPFTAPSSGRLADFIAESYEQGCLLIRDGQDLLRIHPSGEIERVEGWFDDLNVADFGKLIPEHLEQIRALIEGGRGNNLQVAQAQVGQEQVQSDAGPSTPVPELGADAIVAKVAEVTGNATVLRNGSILQLRFGDAIYLGDVITTDATAKIRFSLVDSTQPNQPQSSATLSDQAQVLVTGQIVNSAGNNFVQVNLKVNSGVLSVDKPTNASVDVQVQTPAGQLAVPQTGLNVVIQATTGQTSVSTNPAQGTVSSAPATTNLLASDGSAASLQLSTSPIVLGQDRTVPQVNTANATQATAGQPAVATPPAAPSTATATATSTPTPTPTADAATLQAPAVSQAAASLSAAQVVPQLAPQAGVTPAVAAQVAPSQAASSPAMVGAITGVSPFSPLTGNNLAAPLSFSTEANPPSLSASISGSANSSVVIPAMTLTPAAMAPAALPKASNDITPPIIPKVSIAYVDQIVDEVTQKIKFNIELSSPTSLFVSFNIQVGVYNGANLVTDTRVSNQSYA
jgi:hypothetical protein